MNKDYAPNKEEINALADLADESLRSAKFRLEEGFLRGSVSDSYYTAFYISKALLLKNGLISKTHTGTVRLFGENFVKTGKIEKECGQWFANLLQERTEADYDSLREFSVGEAKEAVDLAEKFFKKAKEFF